MKGVLNPEQDAHIEANKIKLVQQGDMPDKEYLLVLRLELVKNIDPLHAPNSNVNIFKLENIEKWVKEAKKKILNLRP